MSTFNLNINGKKQAVDVDPKTPMLWVLRDTLNLVGTKYGCGIAQCGACTIHVDGVAARSCQLPVSVMPKINQSQPLKAYRKMAIIPCKKRGFNMMFRNVVIVRLDKL
jgi:xanthine dehydrogenase iron-sulfur cluster and FAD-binding subunit A